jgi:hypothetical protein
LKITVSIVYCLPNCLPNNSLINSIILSYFFIFLQRIIVLSKVTFSNALL